METWKCWYLAILGLEACRFHMDAPNMRTALRMNAVSAQP